MIEFKSIPKFWNIEESGLKNNTVRKVERDDPRYEQLLHLANCIDKEINDMIKVTNVDTKKYFIRTIKNVTFFDDYIIITWMC